MTRGPKHSGSVGDWHAVLLQHSAQPAEHPAVDIGAKQAGGLTCGAAAAHWGAK